MPNYARLARARARGNSMLVGKLAGTSMVFEACY